MVKSGQAVTVLFSTSNATTGALADADATPVGTLYVDGTANAATVTETNVSTGIYKAAVTLPALTAGQIVSLGIAATVAGVAGGGIVWQDVADTSRVSDVKSDTAAILVDTGTDGVKIAADAITSATFDESTAFPLKAADTGSTYIARTGADSDTLETLSDQLDTLTTYSAGAGSITFTYTLTDSSDSTPIPDATVEVFSDSTLSTLVAMGTTDSSGEVVFYLDAGTYYLQARKAGYSFSTDTEVVA